MVFRKRSSVLNVALLIGLMTAVTPFAASIKVSSALAQAASQAPLTVPMAVPKGTTVRISGPSSMAAINQALKQRFETQYPDARVTVSDAASSTGLQDLVAGKTDLVAIGRSLTPTEQAQGLIAVPVARRKIAIVVSTSNPFKNNLTTLEVAQILQGKITDWSEVGGQPGAIRVLDRPSNSDLRQALQSYPLFESLSSPGATVTPVSEDSTQAVIQQLGKNGIGYVAANEVVNQPTVRMMALHRALPTDPSYPFSQPLSYVYKGKTPSAAIAAFLKYATSPDAQSAIQTAVQTAQVPASAASDKVAPTSSPPTGANASSPTGSLASASSIPVATELSETASTSATGFNTAVGQKTAASTDPTGGILPWLVWLLPLGIAAVLVAWLIKNRRPASDGAHSESLPPVSPDATPPIAESIAGDPDPNPASRAESVINGDRAAIAQAQPEASRIGGVASEDGLASIEALTGANADEALSTSMINTSPLDLGEIRDPWEPAAVSDTPQEAEFDAATVSTPSTPSLEVMSSQEAGSENVTQNLSEPEESLVSFDLIEELDNLETQLEANEADDLILTNEAATIEPVESAKVVDPNVASMADLEPSPTHVQEQPDLAPATDLLGGAAIAGAAVAGLSAPPLDAAHSGPLEPNPLERNDGSAEQTKVEATKYDVGQTDLSRETLASVDEGLPELPAGYGETRIVLMPRDPQWAYAYWDVPNDRREALRRQGGQRLALRLYDVTDVDLDHQSPHSLQQYDCEELARDWYVAIPVSDRDYLAEIGYLTEEGRWLMLARSAPIRVPPVYPSEWASDQYVTIDWDDDLRGKTVLELVPSERQSSSPTPVSDELFELAQGGESQRIAGSLFGSMQHVPQAAISSFVFPTGMGMWALPTPSGMGGSGALTMSGINMSGINMSGVGFSVPSIRPRKFWLVADAELIVYGATEPDATVTIAGQPIALNPDGTFRFQMSFQDGLMDYPIMAVAADGEQTRSIHLTFNRETLSRRTNSKEEATDEWRS